ncbi:uncharacterized protein [Lolium perenne]|uniref:uncharacterized protein n=1 Tax=Lolium perenne TaxID=4522 RepID=UPI0021F56A91|nr:uncharacterized protein LOC127332040 [Lolium perenne]
MQVIKADNIDVAVEGILNELNRSRQNDIYFDGWDGLGASAVLRAVAQRLALKERTTPLGLEFDQIIHIDCSKWENTRAVQREIAEQLKLPTRVMDMFDKQDEEDDFDGITDQGSRTEIVDVAVEIQRSIQGRRFLLIFHNGSNEEVDISRLGLPVYGYLTNKVVWTFQGRFRMMDPKMRDEVVKKNTTDVLLSVPRSEQDPQHLWSYLVHEESIQVACKHGVDPTIVTECFLYMLTLHCTGRRVVDIEYDLATRACNYWICDVIIQKITDICEAWQVGEALQDEIRLDLDYHHKELPSHLLTYADNIPHWTSPAHGFVLVPPGVVPRGMFQHFDKLGVLKLSRCSFIFSSPPFQCCHSLRFLWLDHCQDLKSTDAEDGEQDEDTSRSWSCFQGLYVLDLRYTDCNWILSSRMLDLMTQLRELNVMGAKNLDGMSHLRGRLRNVRILRITKSSLRSDHVFVDMESVELLDFSGNTITRLYGTSTNSKLKTVIVSGCDDLEIISFKGCKELMNLFMEGSSFVRLQEMNLSGTRVKILDLTMLFISFRPTSKQIILLEKLRTIMWPQDLRGDPGLDVLQIDTTSASASASGRDVEHAHPHGDQSLQQQKEKIFWAGWQISLADTRLLRSFIQ